MTTLKEKLASLPAKRRAAVKARADVLLLEEMTLRDARKAISGTQASIAKRMGIGQDSVSRLEQRDDMLVSTLRGYVDAVGGKVRLIVEIKGQPPFELKRLGRITSKSSKPRGKSRAIKAA